MLNPKLKGHVATTPYASSFDRLATNDMWGKEKTIDVRASSCRIRSAASIRCNEMDRIASGEFDAFGLTCSQNDALASAAKGAPVGFTLASDAPIDDVLSMRRCRRPPPIPTRQSSGSTTCRRRRRRRLLYDVAYADLHLIAGSRTGKSISDLEAKGAKFLIVDTDFYRNHDAKEVDAVLSQVQAIFRGR